MLHIYNAYTTALCMYYTIAISVIHVKAGHISATFAHIVLKVWFCAVDLIVPVGSPLVP